MRLIKVAGIECYFCEGFLCETIAHNGFHTDDIGELFGRNTYYAPEAFFEGILADIKGLGEFLYFDHTFGGVDLFQGCEYQLIRFAGV